MPIAESDVKWVKAPQLTLADRLYLPAIFQGMQTTVKHLFGPKVTQQFPEQRPDRPPRGTRGALCPRASCPAPTSTRGP